MGSKVGSPGYKGGMEKNMAATLLLKGPGLRFQLNS